MYVLFYPAAATGQWFIYGQFSSDEEAEAAGLALTAAGYLTRQVHLP